MDAKQSKKPIMRFTREEFLREFDAPPTDPDDPNIPSVSQILKDARTHNKNRTALYADIGRSVTVSEEITPKELKELSNYYDQALTQMMSLVGLKNSQKKVMMKKGQQSYFTKVDGKIAITQIWSDPTFAVPSANGPPINHTVPGTITSRFVFTPGVGFELQSVEFSNSQLHDLIKAKTVPKNFNKLIQTAAKTECEQHPEPQTLSSEKLYSLYPPARGSKPNFVDQESQKTFTQVRDLPLTVSAIVKTNSLDSSETQSSVSLIEDRKNPVKRTIHKDEDGNVFSRVTVTNPKFQIEKPGHPEIAGFIFILPGTVTLDYSYDPQAGYKFSSLTASNAALYRFILNTPHDPTIEELKTIKAAAEKAEKNSGLIFSKADLLAHLDNRSRPAFEYLTTALKEDLKKEHKFKTDSPSQYAKDKPRFFQNRVMISPEQETEIAKYFHQSILALPNFIATQQTQNQINLAADDKKTQGILFNNEKGETICRITYLNPRFTLLPLNSLEASQKDIPGTITVEYVFQKDKGFELRSMEFSNAALKNLVLNPPKNPTPADLEKTAETAVKEEKADQQENRAVNSNPKSIVLSKKG